METITKEIVKYTSYRMKNGYEARFYDDKTILIVTPNQFEWKIKELPKHTREIIQPLIEFVENDLSHKFTIAENEIE